MRAALVDQAIRVVPGESVDIPVEVRNTSDVVDAVVVTIHGLESGSVISPPEQLALFPDTSGTITLHLAIPANLPAGPRTVSIGLTSISDPADTVVLPLTLDVAVAIVATLTVHPAAVSTRRRATLGIHCANDGNRPFTVGLTARDRERRLRLRFNPPVLEVIPGTVSLSSLRVRAPRRLFGGDRTVPLAIGADGPEVELTANATVTHRPLVPRGLATVVVLGTILALWAIGALLGVRSVLRDDPIPRLVPASFAAPDGGDAGAGGAGAGGESAAAAAAAEAAKLASIGGAAAEVVGIVQAATTDVGLPRVLVQAIRDGGDPPITFSVATGDDGSFTIEGLVPGDYRFRFAADGFDPVWYPGTPDEAAAELVTVDGESVPELAVLLDGRPGTLTGRVGLAVTGAPPPTGTTVELHQVDQDGVRELVATVVAFPDGTFSADGLPTPATYEVAALAPGFEPAPVLEELGAGEQADLGIVAITAGAGSVSGHVTDGDVRVGGVIVSTTAGDAQVATSTLTSGDIGSFSLPDLPTPGRYLITFRGEGFGATTVELELGASEDRRDLDVALVAGSGSVTGRVVDPAGAPIAGATVRVGSSPAVTSGDDGTFAVNELTITARHDLVVAAPGFVSASVPVVLGPDGAATVEVRLERPAGRVSGTVTSSAGGPVEGATVQLGEGPGALTAITAADGTFAIDGAPPGPAALLVTATDNESRTVIVHVVEGADTLIDVEVEPEPDDEPAPDPEPEPAS